MSEQVSDDKTPIWLYWDEFVDDYRSEGRSEITIRNVRDTLRLILTNTKLYSIEEINNPRLLKDAMKEIAQARNWKPSTFNTCRKNLNTYFLWLEAYEYINENKIKKVRKDKEQAKNRYTFTDEQVHKVVQAVYHREQNSLARWRNVLFIHLLSITGARPVELLNLTLDDVYQANNTYRIQIDGAKQNQSVRPYILDSMGRDVFEMYMKTRKKLGREEDFLFVSATNKGKCWTYSGVRKLFGSLSADCGFRVICYGFRRYVATALFKESTPLVEIMHHLGHTNMRTTSMYIDDLCKNQNTVKTLQGKLDKFTGQYNFS
jgi:site-specific recombinase XerD